MAVNWYNETFFQLQIDGDNQELSLTAENLDQLNDQVITKSKSKTVSEEVNGTIIKFKSVLDGFLQQHNILNPKDRNTIECKLSATNFVRKAFQIEGIDGGSYPCIYSFAFYDKMRKTTTISKLEKRGSGYQSQCFCQKSYLCDGEERTGDFKILLAFTNYNDAKIDLYMSMKGFPVLSNMKNLGSSSSSSSSTTSTSTTATDGKKKRKRKEAEIDETSSNKVVVGSSSMVGSSSNVQPFTVGGLSLSMMNGSFEPSSTVEQDLTTLPFATVSASAAENVTSSSSLEFLPSGEGSMVDLLGSTTGDQSVSLPSNNSYFNTTQQVDFQHQMWDPHNFMSLPLFQYLYCSLEKQIQFTAKLQTINEKLKRENIGLRKEIEKWENQEKQVFQKEEKKPYYDLNDPKYELDDICSDDNKPEPEDVNDPFMNFFNAADDFDHDSLKHQQ